MNPPDATTLHDATPEAALAALCDHQGPVLLDLDETLYLRNSTEDFIDSARPGVLALLLLRLLDVLQPWRWTGGEATRDVWRVRLVTLLFPWTLRSWRGRVAGLAEQFTNRPLLAAAKSRDQPPIVATIGFERIVTPLVEAIGLPEARIVAARLERLQDRRNGKLELLIGTLGADTVRSGLVITDSMQDLPLLDACARPLRTVWPQAQYRHGLSGIYLPGQYLTQVKRRGERYILRGILQEDFVYWVLASVALAEIPWLHILGLVLLLISFWAIYERGYVDNDLVAATLEHDPKLTPAFYERPVATPRFLPWLWAAAMALPAISLLRYPAVPTPYDLAAWSAVLAATYLWFRLYNRLDKSTRVWMYAGLQLSRTAAFAVLVPITLVGGLALVSHTLARWIPYYVYRLSGKEWPDAPLYLTRLLFMVVCCAMLAAALGAAPFLNWTTPALFAWMIYRARAELAAMLKAARRLDRRVG